MTSTELPPALVLPVTAPTPAPDPQTAERAYRSDRAHVFHSWSAQAALDPMVIAGGQGSWVWDGAGRPFLDFSSQLVFTNIGLGHPRVVAAVRLVVSPVCCRMCARSVLAGRCRGPMGAGGLELARKVQW